VVVKSLPEPILSEESVVEVIGGLQVPEELIDGMFGHPVLGYQQSERSSCSDQKEDFDDP